MAASEWTPAQTLGCGHGAPCAVIPPQIDGVLGVVKFSNFWVKIFLFFSTSGKERHIFAQTFRCQLIPFIMGSALSGAVFLYIHTTANVPWPSFCGAQAFVAMRALALSGTAFWGFLQQLGWSVLLSLERPPRRAGGASTRLEPDPYFP